MATVVVRVRRKRVNDKHQSESIALYMQLHLQKRTSRRSISVWRYADVRSNVVIMLVLVSNYISLENFQKLAKQHAIEMLHFV